MKTAGRFTPSRGFESHTLRAVAIVAAALVTVMVLVRVADARDATILGLVGAALTAGLLAAVAAPRLTVGRGELTAMVMAFVLVGVIGQLGDTPLEVLTYLPAAAALTVALAVITHGLPRGLLVVNTVVGSATLLTIAEPAPATAVGVVRIALPTVLLATVAVLGATSAGALEQYGRTQRAAAREAQRRARLLDAVRALPDTDPEQAARVVVAALGDAGAPTSGVVRWLRGRPAVLARDGAPVTMVLDAAPSLLAAVVDADRAGTGGDASGLDGTAIVEVASLGTVVVSGVRVDAEVEAVVFAVVGSPTVHLADRERVALLAGHLCGALEAARQTDRQTRLLERLQHLERMRSTFVRRVSTDVRRPVAGMAATAAQLVEDGEHLPAARRDALLARIRADGSRLQQTLEALFDLARLQAGHAEPEIGPVALRQVLAPLSPRSLAGHGRVLVDAVLARHGVELLVRAGGAVAHVPTRRDGQWRVVVVLGEGEADDPLTRISAEQLLLQAGARVVAAPGRLVLLLDVAEEEGG